jgi:DNA-binding CsgD family transcriptional regulator
MNRGYAKRLCVAAGDLMPATPADETEWSQRDDSAFPQLTPFVEWLDVSPRDWIQCWGGMDCRARMVLDLDRNYVVGDCRAERVLSERRDLRLNGHRVELLDPGGMPQLEHLLQVGRGEVRTAFIRRRRLGGHLIMRATGFRSKNGEPLIGIVFWVADEKLEVEWPDFGPVFGLTAAEAKVVEFLIQGLGAELIATELQVSINTVRTHICHVYEKLGITCREELWRRLAPYRVN